jgi:uncharacterized membrane protein
MRWRNYGLWASIASLLYMFFRDMGFQIDLTQWETYVNAILGLLVALGIISNPEKSKGYFPIKKNVTGQTGQQLAQNVQNQYIQNEMANQNQQIPTNEPSFQNSASYGTPMTTQNNGVQQNTVNQQVPVQNNSSAQQGQIQQPTANQQNQQQSDQMNQQGQQVPTNQQTQTQPYRNNQQVNIQTDSQSIEEVEAPPMEQIGAEHNERW